MFATALALAMPLVVPPGDLEARLVPLSSVFEEKSIAARLFPNAKAGFQIPGPGENEWTIANLVAEFGRATGYHVVSDKEVDHLMQATGVGVKSTVEVSKETVYSVTESILMHYGFVLAPVHGEAPRMIRILSLNTSARTGLRRYTTYVPAEQLDEWEQHPAFLITTMVHLPNTDVRTLSNSMRTMLTDANTQQIIPLGSSNSLILTGFAPDICALTATFREADRAAKEMVDAQRKAAQERKQQSEAGQGEQDG